MSDDGSHGFVRPVWIPNVYRDEVGNVIEYGMRWDGEPPEQAYSATSHLERFRPLHQLAAALIEHLVNRFEVRASESSYYARTLVPEPPEFVRVVRLIPEAPHGPSKTIVFTSFPGVAVYTGTRSDKAFPACGCDACDDSVDEVADRLEYRVLKLAGDLNWEPRV